MQRLALATCALIERDTAHVPQERARSGFPWGSKWDPPKTAESSLAMRLNGRITRLEREVMRLREENHRLSQEQSTGVSEEDVLRDELWECRDGLLHAALLIQSLPEDIFHELMTHKSYEPFVQSLRYTNGDFTGDS